jgi:hypothetical protein
MKVRVIIVRDPKNPHSFIGEVLQETDTHYFVQHGVNTDGGEWFPKSSNFVNCHISGGAA